MAALEEETADVLARLIRFKTVNPPGNERECQEWLAAYRADGGVISTWQEMQTSEELADFSRRVAASVFTRLVRLLQRRDFGNAMVDATTLLALIERVPYSVYTLGFTSEADAVENMLVAIRRGFLALDG